MLYICNIYVIYIKYKCMFIIFKIIFTNTICLSVYLGSHILWIVA